MCGVLVALIALIALVALVVVVTVVFVGVGDRGSGGVALGGRTGGFGGGVRGLGCGGRQAGEASLLPLGLCGERPKGC